MRIPALFVFLVTLAGGCVSARTYEHKVAELEHLKREHLERDSAVMARLAQLDQENADLIAQLDRSLRELQEAPRAAALVCPPWRTEAPPRARAVPRPSRQP